jgi:hypothetical protein
MNSFPIFFVCPSHSSGPPYVRKVVMYAGDGVDEDGSGDRVRRIVGVRRKWPLHDWSGNNFLNNFDASQLRFMARNTHSVLIVPPLSYLPQSNPTAVQLLDLYLMRGQNTAIILGGNSNILFLNSIFPGPRGNGFALTPRWQPGPYEKQQAALLYTDVFSRCQTTLPAVGVNNVGAETSSLPRDAVSVFEYDGVSFLFALPYGEGAIIYVGYDYTQSNPAWERCLRGIIDSVTLRNSKK